MAILNFPQKELITQRRLDNYLYLKAMLEAEEKSLIRALERGIPVEAGEHEIWIERLPRKNPVTKLLWVK